MQLSLTSCFSIDLDTFCIYLIIMCVCLAYTRWITPSLFEVKGQSFWDLVLPLWMAGIKLWLLDLWHKHFFLLSYLDVPIFPILLSQPSKCEIRHDLAFLKIDFIFLFSGVLTVVSPPPFFFGFVVFRDLISQCSPGYLRTRSAHQTGLLLSPKC